MGGNSDSRVGVDMDKRGFRNIRTLPKYKVRPHERFTDMSTEQRRELRKLEGRSVNLSLADGSRLDDVSLVSVRARTVWVFSGGEDVFLRVDSVVDFWEATPVRSAA
jgi:hypothetical protein